MTDEDAGCEIYVLRKNVSASNLDGTSGPELSHVVVTRRRHHRHYYRTALASHHCSRRPHLCPCFLTSALAPQSQSFLTVTTPFHNDRGSRSSSLTHSRRDGNRSVRCCPGRINNTPRGHDTAHEDGRSRPEGLSPAVRRTAGTDASVRMVVVVAVVVVSPATAG